MRTGWKRLFLPQKNYFPAKSKTSPGGGSKGRQGSFGKSLPSRFSALVKGFRGEHVLLRWQGKDLLLKLDVSVQRGDYLLLEHTGQRPGRGYYRVLERSQMPFESLNADREKGWVWHHILLKSPTGYSLPFIYRYFPSHYSMPEKRRQKREKAEEKNKPVLEYIIKTVSMGIVVLRLEPFEKKESVKTDYSARLLVESEQYGLLLEDSLHLLQDIIACLLEEKGSTISWQGAGWEIIPPQKKKEVLPRLQMPASGLDKKV